MDISRIVVLEKLIADAERRLGSYVASQQDLWGDENDWEPRHGSYVSSQPDFAQDPYVRKQSGKIQAWTQQISNLLKVEETEDGEGWQPES